MNDLRLILLSAGVLFLLGLYLWENLKQRREQRRQTVHRPPPADGVSGLRINPNADDDTDHSSILADLGNLLRRRNVEAAEEPAPGAGMRRLPTDEEMLADSDMFAGGSGGGTGAGDAAPRVIVINVVAAPSARFSGTDILAATKALGFKFGQMNIFHHHGAGSTSTQQALFSLANMFEPGSFDLPAMDRIITGGLSLFMYAPVPAPVDPADALDLFIETALALARRLDGELLDAARNPLDQAALTAMRETVIGNTASAAGEP